MQLLKYYENKVVDDDYWFQTRLPFKNLAALVAQISTAMKICMVYPVASAMGQLKWYQFVHNSPRQLANLQAYDAASRGIAGSAKVLLSKHRFESLSISLGCIFFLATLGVSSSVQNTITTNKYLCHEPLRGSRFSNASLPFNHNYTDMASMGSNGTIKHSRTASPALQAMVLAAWADYQKPRVTNEPTPWPINCTTGICEFNNVNSLDVDHQCQSVTAVVNSDGSLSSNQANITFLPGEHDSDSPSKTQSPRLGLKSSRKIPNNSTFLTSTANNPALIIHVAAIAEPDQGQPEAVECILYWQMRSDSRIIHNDHADNTKNNLIGVDLETIWAEKNFTNHVAEVKTLEDGKESIVFEGPCNTNFERNMNANGNCPYSVWSDTNLALQQVLENLFTRHGLEKTLQTDTGFDSDGVLLSLFKLAWLRNLEKAGAAGAEFQRSAALKKTLSDYITNLNGGIAHTLRIKYTGFVPGKVCTNEHYEIHWLYVLYMVIMLGITTFLFFFAIWRTRGLPIWKTSILPFLYHGFEHPPRDEGGDFSNIAWMETASQEKQLVLCDNTDGLGLKLRDFRA
nr:uncharacterized protein CTRU02_12694 [Colletotrichum truncatum]KAF6784432.1 hypothetical protein CTRU02_12694 [Colletotrichum truncatum]